MTGRNSLSEEMMDLITLDFSRGYLIMSHAENVCYLYLTRYIRKNSKAEVREKDFMWILWITLWIK
jgi:hypothetical protein